MIDSRKIIDAFRYFVNRKLGYDIVRFLGQHTLRAHLVKVFNDYKIDTIIDVGANEGQFGLFVRSIGFRGNIYSFEPVSGAYETLRRSAEADANWHVFNFALGAQASETYINVSKHTSFSSVLDATEFARKRWDNIEVSHKQKIEIKTLDQCTADGVIALGQVFLKMDTQGFDLEVFRGAQSILPEVRGILSELSLIPVYDGMPNYFQSLSVYESAGFSVSGFYPITRNPNLSLNEVDCVLVNTPLFRK